MSANWHDSTRRGFLASGASTLALSALRSPVAAAAPIDRDLLALLAGQERQLIGLYTAVLDAFDAPAFSRAGLPEGVRAGIEQILAAEGMHLAVVTRPDQPQPADPAPILPDNPAAALRQALQLENLAVAAYAFGIAELDRQRLTSQLLGILSVEARHAAWLATVLNENPYPEAIDAPLTLDAPESPTTQPAGTPAAAGTIEAGPELAPIVAAIANAMQVAEHEVTLVSARRESWPDASLGCPQPDTLYAQVVTPGYWVLVEVGGRQLEFHTDERGNVVRCS